jgi:hypothetical protein
MKDNKPIFKNFNNRKKYLIGIKKSDIKNNSNNFNHEFAKTLSYRSFESYLHFTLSIIALCLSYVIGELLSLHLFGKVFLLISFCLLIISVYTFINNCRVNKKLKKKINAYSIAILYMLDKHLHNSVDYDLIRRNINNESYEIEAEALKEYLVDNDFLT